MPALIAPRAGLPALHPPRGLALRGLRLAWPLLALPRRAGRALHGQLAAEWQRLPLWLPVAMGAGVLFYFGLPEEPGAGWLALPPVLLLAAVLVLRRWPLAAGGWGWRAWRRSASPRRCGRRVTPRRCWTCPARPSSSRAR